MLRNKGNHGAGRRTGININEIIRFDQSSGIFTDPLLFCYIDRLFFGDIFFTQIGFAVYGHGAAEDSDQQALTVHLL